MPSEAILYNFNRGVDAVWGFLGMINTGVVGCVALNICWHCFTVGGI